ncbi:uncharacterized protein I303_101515 [Kwoniella dejecticola CBS 10117]|uniref:NAD-dependent epimerase/dehydratase domain-containing protein n=1 Tax=Kwoniella dejecticola CBS 10117 TaxID=1296121 RepID=A0AAJ8KK95_9TREE
MPIIEKGDLVLVTGASGFLASHAVLAFLQAGYRVRGTVRSKQKGEYLSRLCTSKGLIGFSYVLVPDISVAGAFDDAVVGIDALAHLASPFYTANVADPQELIGPAVNGTVGILKSIANKGVKVKRVVITSSVAAIMSPESRPPPQRYTSEDWNEDSIVQLARNGASSGGVVAYRASKTLAEKAFWDFIEIEKPEWDGIVLNPPLILGEVIHEVESPDRLNTSVAAFWKWLSGQQAESDLPSPLGNYINVKDIALAHVNALKK